MHSSITDFLRLSLCAGIMVPKKPFAFGIDFGLLYDAFPGLQLLL
jgi:hypothetical protein